jgi:hypothetical protein
VLQIHCSFCTSDVLKVMSVNVNCGFTCLKLTGREVMYDSPINITTEHGKAILVYTSYMRRKRVHLPQ